MRQFLVKLSALFARRRKEEDLQEELRFHLNEEADEREAAGLGVEEARLAARRDLGNAAHVQEETRAEWTWSWVEQLFQDVRYGARTLWASKTFSVLAILSLGLGIGANTAIYSFMDWLLMRSLPVADPGSLVVLNWQAKAGSGRDSVMHGMSGSVWRDGEGGRMSGIFPYPAYELVQENSKALFSSVFAYYPTGKVNLMARGQAEMAKGEFVSGDYFRGLGVVPAAGRLIGAEDDRTGAPPVAVLSFAYSQKRFGDSTRAAGESILINHEPFLVAGVAPPGFHGVDPALAPDFYIPLRTNMRLELRGGPGAKGYADANYYWLEMMARLGTGVSREQAEAALGPVFHRWVDSTAINDREREKLPELRVREGASGLDTLRRRYSQPLYVLLAMVAVLLAIVCVNIANLMLARAAARRREMAVRLSIGAGRLRVIRQLLTESVMLSATGGALGVVIGLWGIRFLTVLMANGSEDFPMQPTLNWNVMGVAAGLSLLTGVLFGLVPALQATRVDVVGALKETRAGSLGKRTRRLNLGASLVVAQIGMSLVLLIAAGLFVRTLSNLQSIEMGFNREDILLFQLNARQAGHKDPEIVTFYGDLQQRFGSIPGVRMATAMHHALVGQGTWSSDATPVGKEKRQDGGTHILMTGTNFFRAMEIPILLGRGFEEGDRAGSRRVAIVNEAYVKVWFEGENPIGRHLTIGMGSRFADQDVEIVGVARNARYGQVKGEYRSVLYLPFSQGSYYPVEEMTFALKTSGDPLRFVGTVREIARAADARVPVTDVETQSAQIDRTMSQEIVFARLCTGFAALALLLASIGLYGTVAYAVERRSGEIGIRVALGAGRGKILWMVLRQALVMAVAGAAIGVPVALVCSKMVRSLLFGIEPNDGVSILMAAGALVAALLVAGYVPARRAAQVDPMVAIRNE